jgi:hypothetical protein
MCGLSTSLVCRLSNQLIRAGPHRRVTRTLDVRRMRGERPRHSVKSSSTARSAAHFFLVE